MSCYAICGFLVPAGRIQDTSGPVFGDEICQQAGTGGPGEHVGW